MEMQSLREMGTRLFVRAATRRQKGATIIEYVLLAALIGAVLIGTFTGVTDAIKAAFDEVCTAISGTACPITTTTP